MSDSQDVCPVCHSPLQDPQETKTGKKLQRCSRNVWNPQTHRVEGCTYVKWLDNNTQVLKENCPQCGNPLVLQKTRTGKKMKKCSTGGWDKENMVATGCTYVEWLDQKKEDLDEECPRCGAPLVLVSTGKGKMKKCSTAGWDREFRQPLGCSYVEWLK